VAILAQSGQNHRVTFVRVTGTQFGEAVWATWEDGVIFGDRRLLERARLYIDQHEEIPLGEGGPYVEPCLDNPWSFTVTISSLVEDPVVSGDDLPFADASTWRRNHPDTSSSAE
jgi:hypothetical protein